ncbi:hypothetical protein FACS1894199_17530 [Bacteroidia bacterium]|nr:hypothetical protein FACS1894199_17530 [Bacteroidia bacterium]
MIFSVAKAHEHQRSGAVDDSRIAKLGAQFGEQFVCVVKVGSMGEDKNYLSARIVDVETAKVTKSSKPFTFTIDDLSDVCEDVIAQLFGSTMSRTFGKPKAITN